MELQAVTGQLYIIDGSAQDITSVPGLLAQSAPARAARGRERDFLFVHLTLTGRPEETDVLTQDLLDAVSRRYYQSSGSVTAALRQATLEINELLLRLNLSGISTSREGAISCAALHSGELFMVQAGEALAMLGHNFGVERLPQEAPERASPLGRTAGIDLRYYHHRLQPGDTLLLADPRIAHLPSQSLTPALVDTEVEFGLEELRAAIGDESARLLLVEFTDQAPADFPDASHPARASGRPLATIPQPVPQREGGGTAVLSGTTAATERLRQPLSSLRHQARRTSASLAPSVTEMGTTARKASSSTALALSEFTRWLAEVLARLRPRRSTERTRSGWAVPAILAVAIPVVVAVVVTSVYMERGRVRRFAEIKVEMGQLLAEADSAVDAASAGDRYRATLILAQEAESLRPNDAEITLLRQQAMTALDTLEGVTRLTARAIYVYEEKVLLAKVALREGFNGGIFTFDRAGGVVYEHETGESYVEMTSAEPSSVVFVGQAVGSHVVGTLVDFLWRARGSAVTRDGLAMLDTAGTVFTYYPNLGDVRAVPLGLASEWQFPLAITSFDERLYVLDVGRREIWKYFPDGDGFILKEDERTLSFTEDPGLEQAVDLLIYSEDGSLLLLFADGRIRYYDTRSGRVKWDEVYLLQNGLGSPLIAPVAVELAGKGLNASFFIADPGSGRIVQVSRGGTVLAQYRATDELGRELFSRISDFAVAETPLRIFATAGNTLYLVTQD